MNRWITTAAGVAFVYGTFRPDREVTHDHVEPNPPATITLGLSAVTTTGSIVAFDSQITARGDG